MFLPRKCLHHWTRWSLVFSFLWRRVHCACTTDEKLMKAQTSVIKVETKLYVEHEASLVLSKTI